MQGAHSQVGPGQRHGSSGGSEAAAGDNQGSRLGLKGHCYVDGAGPGHGRARTVGAAVLVAAAVTVWQGRQCRAGLGGGSAGQGSVAAVQGTARWRQCKAQLVADGH